jgi:hypothetical protein
MKQFIEGLGLDPVLSEHASFPVNPDVGTVDNCLEVVEAKADIFVLIVGGRYGPAAETDKSVTNLELRFRNSLHSRYTASLAPESDRRF